MIYLGENLVKNIVFYEYLWYVILRLNAGICLLGELYSTLVVVETVCLP
jgi:hypothetical protein